MADKGKSIKKQSSTAAKKKKTSTVTTRKESNEEHRSDQRIPIQLLVDYKADGHYLFDFCKDLGTGGVFIQTPAPLPQDSSVDLTFTIPDSKETLQAKGKVIWVQEKVEGKSELVPGMGVQFYDFDQDQRKTLEDFVERYHTANDKTDELVHKKIA